MGNWKLNINFLEHWRSYFGVILFLNCLSINGQQFSLRLDTLHATQINDVMLTDNGYMTIVTSIDTVGMDRKPLFTMSFDFFGNSLHKREYYWENWALNSIVDNNAKLNDSTWVVTIDAFEMQNDTMFAIVMWLDGNGDTIRTRKYVSPYYYSTGDPNNISAWMRPTSMATSDDESIYFVSQIIDYPPIQNGFIVKKVSITGEEVWTYLPPISESYYSCSSVLFYEGNPWVLVAGWSGEFNKLVKIDDSTGVMLWEVALTDNINNIGYANDMIIDSEGVVVPCLKFDGQNQLLPAVYRMDYDGNMIWIETPIGNFNAQQKNDHIARAQDGGFVCCSEKRQDYLIGDEGNHVRSIWLWKVDENGALQWERNYEYFSVDSGYWNLYNIAHDFKATPDGGFICAGEATALCTDYPECDHSTQQGWLLKVDGCGCLVPGCDENCVISVNENESTVQSFFKVGPNPASDDFYVYLSKLDFLSQKLELSCLDETGKVMRTFPIKHDDTTYVIDVRSLSAGTYFLQLTSDNEMLQTERVLVVR